VEFVAPRHCTGERATGILREAFGDRCISSGLGRRLDSELLGTIAGVYAGPGATRAEHVVSALERAGVRHRPLDAEDVRLGDFKGCSLVVMPGGRTAEMLEGLADEGLQNIQNFVQQGAGYVGICAGAYMAAPRVKIPGRPPGLGLLEIENRRRAGQGERTVNLTSPHQPLAEDCPEAVRLWWENGPAVGASENVQVVGRYEDGTAAIVCGRYGKGKVVLSGPHPEGRTGEEGGADETGAAGLLRNAVAFAGGSDAEANAASGR
jgi:glutamine amidotransferase PdxT